MNEPMKLSRRDFLRLAAVSAGLAASGYSLNRLGLLETNPAPQATGSPTRHPKVALIQADNYERKLVKQKVQELVEAAGGLAEVVSSGAKAALKVNLIGGFHFQPPEGYSAPESYITHPEVTRALCELLIDAGASKLYIVEGLYDPESSVTWGYTQMAKELGAEIIDLNQPEPYTNFARVPTGPGWLVYESFWLNGILAEVDACLSVAKLKCHYECGITLSLKNMIGIVPVSKYRLSEEHWWRSALHGQASETKTRLPRAILDLNRARPVDFALIDGIMTAEGGETPRGSFHPIQPGILIAGTNPVAVDAVGTAAMGFDPQTEPPHPPFLRADNYLNLARDQGMGTNLLAEIDVSGIPIENVETKFEPAWEE